ncbi:MAG: tryptophan-rich sensory protein [Phycisphaerae bacterium]|nr:tryptophan-rich sensory protein [Phycisphaerae bacterium]
MTPRPALRQVLALLVFVVVTFVAAGLGGLGSADAPDVYSQLAKPAWAPPAWLFGPVWTVLYALMAVAAWLVWRRARGATLVVALSLYGTQLLVNALWSWLFFRWRLGLASFADIVLLWLLVAATGVAFWRVDRTAAGLLVPYLAWITFAAVLNWTLWRANPGLLG